MEACRSATLRMTPPDVAIGPASGGGYYAILCRRAHKEMFSGITWSTLTTAAETANAMQECGFTVALGPAWYDIVTPAYKDWRTTRILGSATHRALRAAAHLPSS
jgi:glycosyltransferase A (GT-A) superfamily protein (DUF2064 family)